MILDCVSDLHGEYPKLLGGDVLIVAGDLTACDIYSQMLDFYDWLEKQDYELKIFIAGNHDGLLKDYKPGYNYDKTVLYLRDSGVEFRGFKIWGSPWTPTFYNWHFMKDRGAEIRERWDLIPKDTDILITHGPPHGILDSAKRGGQHEHVGCEELYDVVREIKPKLHVFGHIHGAHGIRVKDWSSEGEKPHSTIFVNASIMDDNYEAVHSHTRVCLKEAL
jgi:Icc-related predicted phosphoesterase